MINTYKRPLHILIDGPDKLGKTTVINLLAKKLGLPIIKMPNAKEYIKAGNIEEFSKFYNEVLVQFEEMDFIMDRGFTSTIAYSNALNRGTDLAYTEKIRQRLQPIVFIFSGYNHAVDEIPEIEAARSNIEYEFERIADYNGYYKVDVRYKSPLQICNEILKIISSVEESLDSSGTTTIQNSL